MRRVLLDFRGELRGFAVLYVVLTALFGAGWVLFERRALDASFLVALAGLFVAITPMSYLRWNGSGPVARLGCRRQAILWLLAIGWLVATMLVVTTILAVVEVE